MRRGEKMHEALTYAHEALEPTPVDGVNRVTSAAAASELLDKQLTVLIEAARRQDASEALRLLGALVPEYGAERGPDAQRLPA
jgi:O-antigen biosynthesis protein WbqV